MRKGRLLFWIISLVVCAIIIIKYKEEEKKIPYEEKVPMNVYCMEEFQEKVKKIIEESSIGENYKVVFTDNKEQAEFIFADDVTNLNSNYKRVGWTPLIVAFDNNNTADKIKNYKEAEYLTEVSTSNGNSSYMIDFAKIINDTIAGNWTDKIYCPNLDTLEGKLFFDFLIININDGRYPEDKEKLQKCIQKADEFLNASSVVQLNAIERLQNKKVVTNELYIIFENEIYNMKDSYYEFQISYPTNTVAKEFYYCCKGENGKELKELFQQETLTSEGNRLQDILYNKRIRTDCHNNAYETNKYKESDGFSYVEIPLKEE